MKQEQEPQPLIFKGICKTHGLIIESPYPSEIARVLGEHIRSNTCEGVEFQTFKNGVLVKK